MPSTRPAGLPDFERPPLDEVVLSIQFADLPFKNYHAGILWLKLKDKYPKVEEQGPIAATFETYGVPQAAPEIPPLKFLSASVPLRYWFVSSDGTQLLQIQADRLVHNWRRKRPEDNYPRYEAVRDRFKAEIEEVAEFFRANEIGEIKCNQCEVSYINIIDNVGGEDPIRELGRIFTVWSENYSNAELKHIEQGSISCSYLLGGEDGKEPRGRLRVSVTPAMRAISPTPVLRFDITVRGRPETDSMESALKWLDAARIDVVQAFTALTRKEMHVQWGRKRQ
jgi:uncharacterized protein (TIGR04255 family)